MNTTIPLPELRRLSNLASRASAALIPLASDGEGRDSHGGKLRNPEATLDGALDALEQAGALVAQLRATTGHPDRGDDLVALAGRENFQGTSRATPDKGDRPRSSPA